ncbi:MAG TPA: LemA family protein [Longimicrobium sp.]|nr:LemA family protein [Longimicrobium sp.]
MLIALIVVAAVVVLFLILSYNSLIRLRLQAQNAWSDIDVQLKRRYDLVPNLVETVKGYAAHERATLDSVTQARTRALSAASAGPAARAEAEASFTTAIHGLVATAEAYPQLQASGGFRDLQQQLSGLEEALTQARRYYNAVVRDLNAKVMSFPTNLIAGSFGVHPREFFEAGAAERETPKVSF